MQSDEDGYDRILSPQHRPDWNVWKGLKKIKLWQAVALACDLDPDRYTFFESESRDIAFRVFPGKFDDLLLLAKNNLVSGSILKPLKLSFDDVEQTEVAPSNFGSWAKSIRFPLPAEFPWQDEPDLPLTRDWPWGKYETKLLHQLALAANRFWRNYDHTDSTTAPTNDDVSKWLVSQGVSERTADIMATILRADGLRTGPRK